MSNPRSYELRIAPPGRRFTDQKTNESWILRRGQPVAFEGKFYVVEEDLSFFQRQYFPWTGAIPEGAVQ